MAISKLSEPSSSALHVQVGASDTVDEAIASELLSLVLFDLGAQAVGDQSPPGRTVLVAGFETVELADQARTQLLQQHPNLVASAVVEEVLASSWVEAQKDGLEPTQIGPWNIRGPWHREPDTSLVDPFYDIVIDPGTAFGHGAHPTTQLMIELMLQHLTPETAPTTTVVDLGTGTGVAAIIAARLGATVRAIEIDQNACEAAWFNIERNSAYPFEMTTDGIELINGDAAEARVEPGDLVLANVTLDIHALIADRASRSHQIVTSGFLGRQVKAMQDLYSAHSPSTILRNGEWTAIDFLIDYSSRPKELGHDHGSRTKQRL